MKRINFKLFFYIILAVLILEFVIIFLSQKDIYETQIKEYRKRLNYETESAGEKLEQSLGLVKEPGENLIKNIENIETINGGAVKATIDKEISEILRNTAVIGTYYEINTGKEIIKSSMYYNKDENKYKIDEGIDELEILKNESDINNKGTTVNSFGYKEWKMPYNIKSWNKSTGLYKEEIKNNRGLEGYIILAIDTEDIEKIISNINTENTYYFINSSLETNLTNENFDLKYEDKKKLNTEIENLKNEAFRNYEKTGVLLYGIKRNEIASYYKFDNDNILIMKREISGIQIIEFLERNTKILIVLNLLGVSLIYLILKNKFLDPNEKIKNGLLDISEKNLTNFEFLSKHKDKNNLYKSYDKMLRDYSDFVLKVKNYTGDINLSTEDISKKTNILINKNSSKESKVLNISSLLQKNQVNSDKVYNLMMESHKVNTVIQNEINDINRNITLLRENFIKERENGDLIGKLINEVNKISFQINVFGLNSTIEIYSGSAGSGELEESSKEIRHLANRIKLLSEEIKIILKKEKLSFQLKNKSLNLITDYISSFSERLMSIRKRHEKEIVRYVSNKESLIQFSSDIELLRDEILKNREIYSEELYKLKKIKENTEIFTAVINEYKVETSMTKKKGRVT